MGSARTVPERLPETLPVLPEQVALQAQSWQWTQTTGESTHIEIRADGFSQGAEGGGTDLQGVLLKIFHVDSGTYDRVESAAMSMAEDGALYSDGETFITVGVPVAGGGSPVAVTTSGVAFQPDGNQVRTERSVRYEFKDGSGRSEGASYDAGAGTLRMESQAYLERFQTGRDSPTTRIWAGTLLHSERDGRIELSGGVRIEQDTRWLKCESGSIWLDRGRVRRVEAEQALGGGNADGQESRFAATRLRIDFDPEGRVERLHGRGVAEFESSSPEQRLLVRGGVLTMRFLPGQRPNENELRVIEVSEAAQTRLTSLADGNLAKIEAEALVLRLAQGRPALERIEASERGRLEQYPANAPSPARVFEADTIHLAFDSSRLERLAGQGNAHLLQRPSAPGSLPLRTWSEAVQASFSPDTGEMLAIHQDGAFRFEEESRSGRAREARVEAGGTLVELRGAASIAAAGSSVSARRILLERATGKLEAEGAVTAAFDLASGEAPAGMQVGLFAAGEPVYVAAERLVSDPERALLEYRGRARLWQQRNRIDADSIVIDQNAQALSARGNVAMAWPEREPETGAPPAELSAWAAALRYEESTRTARFSGNAGFQRGGLRVRAAELQAALGEGGQGGGFESMVASGAVRLAEGSGAGLRGFADRMEYRPAQAEMVLAGQPARIVNSDGSESQGASLTYRTAGDSLLVLGQGAERAYSYRPPAR